MPIVPTDALLLLAELAPAFTRPTFPHFLALLGAALLTTGRRTIANLLRIAGALTPGHRASHQRVRSQAQWSPPATGRRPDPLSGPLPAPPGLLILVGDDTVDGHHGQKGYGKAATVTPSVPQSYTAWRYGHQ